MKRLYIIRHAKSSWKDAGLKDIDRPLNRRGKKNAPLMARRLREGGVRPDILITSPAKRALSTARAFAKELDYPKKSILRESSLYLSDVETLLGVIQNLDSNVNTAFLFGHNPGLTDLCGVLSGKSIDNLPTAGVFCVDFSVNGWTAVGEGSGIFVSFDYPKKHERE